MTTPSYRGAGGAAALGGLKTEGVGCRHVRLFVPLPLPPPHTSPPPLICMFLANFQRPLAVTSLFLVGILQTPNTNLLSDRSIAVHIHIYVNTVSIRAHTHTHAHTHIFKPSRIFCFDQSHKLFKVLATALNAAATSVGQ